MGWWQGHVAALRAAVLVSGLALGLGAPGRSVAQGRPPASDPVPVAEAYAAAWNAHNLPAVVALFAPDAVVRERQGEVPAAVWETHDPDVVRAYLDGAYDGDTSNTNGFVWVSGRSQIAVWAAARFARHHAIVPAPRRAAGDAVAWRYQELLDPLQVALGVGPLDGEAEAVVRDGRITRLSLVVAPEAVQRLRNAVRAAAGGAPPAPRAPPARTGARGEARQPRGTTAEPPPAAWPLTLGALALLGVVIVALRRRWRF